MALTTRTPTTATIVRNFDNVKNGQKVRFRLCGYDDGKEQGCSAKAWWEE
ncbi:hypothetical protein [Streptomyces sp. NBC_00046]